MSFWEFDPFDSRVTESIEIQPQPDKGWCDMVSEYYGKGNFRAVLKSHSFIREKKVPVGNLKSRYLSAPEESVNEQGVAAAREIVGVFAGLELRPDHLAPDYSQDLYALITNAADAETGELITGQDDVCLLIPVGQRVIRLTQY